MSVISLFTNFLNFSFLEKALIDEPTLQGHSADSHLHLLFYLIFVSISQHTIYADVCRVFQNGLEILQEGHLLIAAN